MRNLVLIFIAFFLAEAHAVPNRDANTVVMISVDGLAGFYLDDPKAEMPNIRALAAAGARAKSMKASTPTVTWPNHTTLVTGVTPARHGVIGNNYYDRVQQKRVTLILDPTYDKDQIVKAPTIYDVAKSNGLATAAVFWPATRNAKTLDWVMPEVGSRPLFEQFTTDVLLKDCAENGIQLSEIFSGQASEAGDALYTQILSVILEKHRPQLALLHLRNLDHVEHAHGPRSKQAYEAIKAADAQVGKVWKILQEKFADRAALLVVSDHGFSPIRSIILPNVILRDAGLIKVNGKRVSGSVQTVVQGGAAMLYVLDEKNRENVIKRVTKAFRDVKGVSKIVGPENLAKYGLASPAKDPNAPDMILFADKGYSFGDTAAGALAFNEKPERFGSHGHDPALPDLHAMFVAWGVGIKSGVDLGEIENTDVAPTIARLLRIPFPSAEGKPLEKLLK